jgi:pimeloyl-ACP methyl ester carboxylesterase
LDRPELTGAQSPLVYVHGLPGSPDELPLICDTPMRFFAPNLRDGPLDPQITAQFGDQPVTLIGFSLGAFRALRFAADYPERVAHLHLIAPAAPLELGDFLGQMAGGPIFRLARDHPNLFRLVTRLQAFASRIAPEIFAAQIFANAQGDDIPLKAKSHFLRDWGHIARHCLADGAEAYRDEITAYVTPWAELLSRVQTPTSIWYGRADNWTPPAMAEALINKLPIAPQVCRIENGSHYSTLAAALAQITAPYRRANNPC